MGVVNFTLDADDAKAVQGFLNVLDAQKKNERQLKRTIETSKKAGRQTNKMTKDAAKGWKIIGDTIKASALVAGGAYLALIQKIRQEQKAALTDLQRAAQPLRRLAQIAGGDPVELARLQKEVGLSVRQGLTEPAAANLQFTVESFRAQGLPAARGTFASLGQIGADPVAVADVVGGLTSALGKKEVGTPRQVVNKLLLASAESRVDVTQLAGAAARPAPFFAAIGASDEELLAALAVQARAQGGAEAGTQLKSLASFIGKKEIGEGGFLAGVERIRKDPKLLKELRGSEEAFAGFKGIIDNMAEVLRIQKLLFIEQARTGGKGDLLRKEIASLTVLTGIPELQGMQEEEALRSRQRRIEGTAGAEASRRAARAFVEGQATEGGERAVTGFIFDLMNFLGVAPTVEELEEMAMPGQELPGGRRKGMTDEDTKKINENLKELGDRMQNRNN